MSRDAAPDGALTPCLTAGAAVGLVTSAGRTQPVRAWFLRSPAGGCPSADAETLAALFPGRWNARRELPDGLRSLVAAFAAALSAAGWWSPGQREPVDGGLVLGTDFQGLEQASRYAVELAERGPAGIGPTGFLFSLPSSAAAVLGILFGLRSYQATLTADGLAGFQAVAHGIDRIALGRGRRLAIGALTRAAPAVLRRLAPTDDGAADTGLELAVALAIEAAPRPKDTGSGVALEWALGHNGTPASAGDGAGGAPPERAFPDGDLDDLPALSRQLAAPALLALLRQLVVRRAAGWITLAPPGDDVLRIRGRPLSPGELSAGAF